MAIVALFFLHKNGSNKTVTFFWLYAWWENNVGLCLAAGKQYLHDFLHLNQITTPLLPVR